MSGEVHRRVAQCAAVLLVGFGLPESVAAEAPEGWSLTPRDGVVYRHEATDLTLDLDGRFAVDWVEYDDRNVRSSGLRFDRAWLSLAGSLGERADARVSVDLDGKDTPDVLWEAWASYRPWRGLRLTGGLMRIPLGMEDLLGEGAQPLPGYPGFVAFLTRRTDWALRLDGELGEGLLDYELTGALGEGFDLFGQRRAGPQLSARVTSYPLRFVDWEVELGPYTLPLLSGIFVNAAYAWSPNFEGHLDVATPLRNKLFLTPRLDADEQRFFVLGYGLDLGPVRVIHELTRGSLEGVRSPGGARVDLDDQITAWQILVSWRITGEPYDSRPFRRRDAHRPDFPRRPLDASGDERGFGAVELSFRYANGDIDRDFFDLGFTSFTQSSQEFRTATVGLNWDPTPWLRVSGEVVRVIADQFPAVFRSHGRDTSGMARVQVAF
jgi:hypothetical protein